MEKNRKVWFLLIMFFIIAVVHAQSSDVVAYIYNKNFNIDTNVINELNSMGLNVELIPESRISTTNFSKYRVIFIGNEKFSNPSKIPINKFPSIIANKYHGSTWGLTDGDSISTLVSNTPLKVRKDGVIIQVYTSAFFRSGNSVAIPYYYLANGNKDPDFITIVEALNGGDMLGDVISYSSPGNRLINGDLTNDKICFYGLTESEYWTNDAKKMFNECVVFVAGKCKSNNECGETIESQPYCGINGKDILKNITTPVCENPGTLNSNCVGRISQTLINTCEDACQNGTCINFACKTDDDCNDRNQRTEDRCNLPGTLNSFCSNENILCFNNEECGDSGFKGEKICFQGDVYQEFETNLCTNAGTSLSDCMLEKEFLIKDVCQFGCSNGECLPPTPECNTNNDCPPGFLCANDNTCKPISPQCLKNEDCNDNNFLTIDECVNPGSVNSFCRNTEINCAQNSDCGTTGFVGENFCHLGNIYKNFKESKCNSPGTLNSFCSSKIEPILVQECNDNNPLTTDSCIESSSVYCAHTPLECISDNDCKVDEICMNKRCIPGIHDVGFNLNLVNSINGIKIEKENGQVVSNEEKLMCNEKYKIVVEIKNFGDFLENVIFEGNIGTLELNYPTENNFAPGTSKLKIKTETINLVNGAHDIMIKAIIPKDATSSNNIAIRNVEVECPTIQCTLNSDCNDGNELTIDSCVNNQCINAKVQCTQNRHCGMQTSQLICEGKNVINVVKSPLCLANNLCSQTESRNFIQSCEFGCSNGECLPFIGECRKDSDCDDGNRLTIDSCVNNFCRHTTIQCTLNSDCNDGNELTIDSCVNNQCINAKVQCTQNRHCGM
ncbi:MAG: hypothetical protein QXH60_00785, partial [Candidatus Pacearchaeota archaeon]